MSTRYWNRSPRHRGARRYRERRPHLALRRHRFQLLPISRRHRAAPRADCGARDPSGFANSMLNTDRIYTRYPPLPGRAPFSAAGRRESRPARSGRPNWSKLLVFSAGDVARRWNVQAFRAPRCCSPGAFRETSLKKRLSPLDRQRGHSSWGRSDSRAFADPGPDVSPAVAHLRCSVADRGFATLRAVHLTGHLSRRREPPGTGRGTLRRP